MTRGLIKEGSYLIVTRGTYDSYGAIGLVRAKKDIDLDKLFETYELLDPPMGNHTTGEVSKKFIDWLYDGGFIEKLNPSELYLGDFGEETPQLDTDRYV